LLKLPDNPQVSEEECTALLDTMRLAGAEAAEPEAISGVLVQLLVKWAERGRGASPRQMSVSKDGQDESPPGNTVIVMLDLVHNEYFRFRGFHLNSC
jgi:hypothetical protein